ncbi:MAG: hypothetical protein ABIS47_11240 [Acidimicrobiales bacterium]
MGLGEILDAAFKLYRANFKPIALVALAFTGPLSILAAVAARSVNGGYGLLEILRDPSLADKAGGFGGVGALAAQLTSSLLLGLSGTMVAGVVATAAAATYRGEEVTAGQAVRATVRFFPALLVARMLVWLSEGVGLLGCGVGAIAVMGLWVVTAPAIVVEGLGPLRGMRRSLRLCTGRYWPVLGTALLSGVIASSLSTVVSGVPNVAAGLVGYRWGFPLIAIGTTATAVLVAPLSAIVATLIYFDLRIRQEGLDLQLMAQGDRHGAAAA